jgi:membrane protease subunit (stomatin/prohibitin family)
LPIEKFAANLEELSKLGMEKLNTDFADYGLSLGKFLVENVSMPEELKKEIFEYSRLNKIDLNKLAQMKAAKSIEIAAENQGGTMGMGMGMGMGFGMGNVMNNALSSTLSSNPAAGNQNAGNGQAMPPPMPAAVTYFVALNGQQAGPFTEEQLLQMAQSQQVKRDTLVWKNGMAAWTQAGQVAELNNLFGAVPPPMPPLG